MKQSTHRFESRRPQSSAALWIATAIAAAPLSSLAQEVEDGLQEITVTAQKRSESAQDVPIAISAFSSDMLEQLGVTRAQDFVAQVPNMTVFNVFGASQAPSLGIRGVTLTNFNDSFESPVAMYIDEVYQGSLVGQTSQLFDIERIEVLKGPQGTLYGRNSTGGLIHAITHKPTKDLQGQFSAEVGKDDLTVVSGALGGPLSERVRGRLAVERRKADGWAKGFLDGLEYGDEDTIAVRGILDVDVSERGVLELAAQYSKIEGLGGVFGLRGYLDPLTGERCSNSRIESGECVSPSLGGRSANDLGGLRPEATPGSGLSASRGSPPEQSVRLKGGSARLDWDYDTWKLTALAAYNEVEKFYEEDLDADGPFFDDGLTLDGKEKKLELRAAGAHGPLTWVAGAFYFDDRKDTGSFLIPADIYTTRGIVNTESWAVFSQADLAFAQQWKLTAGVRYTQEDKSLDFERHGFIEDAGSRKFDTSDVTGRLALSWQPTNAMLLYASVSSGFKTGGFNTQFIFGTLDELDPVDNEKIVAYELGMKSEWLDGRARFNVSGFYSDYRDIQLNVFTTIPGAPFPSNFLRNSGNSKIRGVDLELTLAPFKNTFVMIGAGLLHARLDSDQLGVGPDGPVPLDGKHLMGAPDSTFNIMLSQTLPLAERGAFYVQADYAWRDRTYFSTENVDTESEAAYGLLDGAIGWRSPQKTWDVQAYVRNALDKKYSLVKVDMDSTFGVVTWGRPRWYGLRVSYAL